MTEMKYNIPEGYEVHGITHNDEQVIILLDKKDERVVVKGFK